MSERQGGQSAEKDAPVTGVRFVRLRGTCPHCGLRKNQIDTSEEHAIAVLEAAFDRHIEEDHPPCRECGPGYRIGSEGCRHTRVIPPEGTDHE